MILCAYRGSVPAQPTHILISFGGGSEIMRDGDKNGVWTLIEEGLTYVRFLYLFVHTSIFTCIRFACFFAHVPWLGVYANVNK